MGTTVTTVKGKPIKVDPSYTELGEVKFKYPNVLWWILWALIFWPVLFILPFMRKKVGIIYFNSVKYEINERCYYRLADKIE